MFALKTVASRVAQANTSLVVAKRSHSVIAGPARNKVSFMVRTENCVTATGQSADCPKYLLLLLLPGPPGSCYMCSYVHYAG